ncbi:transporter substrate-binding domain-containing protein [Patescibacteria group bacterium]|nr:transporter substrate-binding domain-containing protein [Patescibacteria group bacterium]
MNKKYTVLIVLIVLVIGGFIAWKMNAAMPVKESVASGHPEWPPIMYQNGDVIDGAGPALVKKIFADLNIPVSFPATGAWDQVQAKAKTGEVDVLVAAYKTDARLEYMEYSEAYTVDPIALFVAKGKEFTFSKWDDLKTKRGVAMTGDSYGQEFDTYSAENLKFAHVATTEEALAMLASGQADYFIYSLYAGNVMLKNTKHTDQYQALPKTVADESFYITISKKSPLVKYMPQINAEIQKYKADGTIDALVAQYNSQLD